MTASPARTAVEQLETGVLLQVVRQFVDSRHSTSRRALVLSFKNAPSFSQAIWNLLNQGLIRRSDPNPEECYLPTAAAFHFCGDAQFMETAKAALTPVLCALQEMYGIEQKKEGFVFDDLKRRVHSLNPGHTFDDETLKLGLYLAQDFGVFSGNRSNPPANTEVTWFQVGEGAITMANPETEWDSVMARYKRPEAPLLETRPAAIDAGWVQLRTHQERPAVKGPIDYQFHPEIEKVSGQLLRSGQYRQAVLDAYIHLLDCVKTKSGVHDREGDDLINQVFGADKKKPILRFNSLASPAELDEHRGFFFILKGVVGLRNYKAHKVTPFDDPQRAHEYVALASLLMRLLDSSQK